MAQKVKNMGLCETCRHRDNCSMSGERNRCVHYCEEFEVNSPPRKSGRKARKRKNPNRGVLNPAAPIGLCRNCEKYPSCTLPKPSGGVWYCEEYE